MGQNQLESSHEFRKLGEEMIMEKIKNILDEVAGPNQNQALESSRRGGAPFEFSIS